MPLSGYQAGCLPVRKIGTSAGFLGSDVIARSGRSYSFTAPSPVRRMYFWKTKKTIATGIVTAAAAVSFGGYWVAVPSWPLTRRPCVAMGHGYIAGLSVALAWSPLRPLRSGRLNLLPRGRTSCSRT